MIKLIHKDCMDAMKDMSDNTIDLCITSPPYWNLKEYSHWETYEDYLLSVDSWISEVARVVKFGRHICWNIQHFLPDKRNGERYHRPLSADTINLAYKHDLMLDHRVIWHKPNGRNQRMFGSYPYPPTIIYTPNYEDILIFRKRGKPDLANKSDGSMLTKDEWASWTLPIWTIPVDYVNRGHPAHFPIELPRRCIRLHSFEKDTILDPFMGSGTTGIACAQTGRRFIGIEIDEGYVTIAEDRIKEAQAQKIKDITQ